MHECLFYSLDYNSIFIFLLKLFQLWLLRKLDLNIAEYKKITADVVSDST